MILFDMVDLSGRFLNENLNVALTAGVLAVNLFLLGTVRGRGPCPYRSTCLMESSVVLQCGAISKNSLSFSHGYSEHHAQLGMFLSAAHFLIWHVLQ
jgi:hypothetical protein